MTRPRHRPPPRRRTSAGFTLIELSLALALAAVFLAMSWPSFRSLRRGYLLEITAQDVVNCMNFARASAVAEQTVYRLVFVAGSESYVLTRLAPQDRQAGFIPAPGRWGAGAKIDGSLTMQPPADPILFYPNGTATGATLILKSGALPSVSIALSGPLGYAKIIP